MTEIEADNLEYIGKVFKGLSTERKDYLLETARSLFKVQYGDIHLVENETNFLRKNSEFTFLKSSRLVLTKKY